MNYQQLDDQALLNAILEASHAGDEQRIFRSMLLSLDKLTPKQRAWAEETVARLNVDDGAVNLHSSGAIPDPGARFAPLDALLADPKPLKPPTRRP